MAWPSDGKPPRSNGRGRRTLGAALVAIAVVAGVVAVAAWLGSRPQNPQPSATAQGAASPSPQVSSTPAATATPAAQPMPLAVVSGFDQYKFNGVSIAQLKARLGAGTLIVPCGAEAAVAAALGSDGQGAAPCVAADAITASLDRDSADLALIPPALVTPRVKVVPLAGADLFGTARAREKPYPLSIVPPTTWSPAWSAFAAGDVRLVLTTGCTCPDRGVAYQTITKGKGWDWLAEAGTAAITGTHIDARFGERTLNLARTGNAGAVKAMTSGADVTMSDFECPMTKNFKVHLEGTNFTIDPRVATLMADVGIDVATIATDHMGNAGLAAIGETVDYFRKAGIQPSGAGRNLTEALKPAVVDANGIKFGFVGFDAIGGTRSATASGAGVAKLTSANVKAAVARARAAGAQVVIAMVQWSSVEYRVKFTDFQLAQEKILYAAGVDHVIGDDFHWAGALKITRDVDGAYHYTGASQGNFWFDQNWSQNTEEGVSTSLTFVGSRLVQVRLQSTVVVDNAQLNLTDPASDGQHVLDQVLSASTLPAR